MSLVAASLPVLAFLALFAIAPMLLRRRSLADRPWADRSQRAAVENERLDHCQLAQIGAMDPAADLMRLLEQTSATRTDAVRAGALRKLYAHGDFVAQLAALLRSKRRDPALVFLADNEAPDAAALVEPVREALLALASDVRRRMRESHHLWNDSFDVPVRRALAAAQRIASATGADYRAEILSLRGALDEPRRQDVQPQCRGLLDAWLSAHA